MTSTDSLTPGVADAAAHEGSERDELNARIHLLLFRRKMTKKNFAIGLGLSVPTGSKKLNGHIDWSASELRRAAQVLDTSVAYLVGEVDDDAPLRKMKNAPAHEGSGHSYSVAGAGLEPATSRL